MSLELMQNIESIFDEIENHSTYFIRKKVYQEGGSNGTGLFNSHQQYQKIIDRIVHISQENLNQYSSDLETSLLKLLDTIRLILSIDGLSGNRELLNNYIDLTSHEIEDLEEVVRKIENYDSSTISDPEISRLKKIDHLREVVEDNLNQLPKSFAWKNSEQELKNSIDGQELINLRWSLMLEAKMELQLLENEKAFLTLINLVSKIKDSVGKNIHSMEKNLPVMISFIRLYQQNTPIKNISYNMDREYLQPEDIRQDLDHLLNTNRLSWITTLHEHYVGRSEDIKKIKEFSRKLYELSRDPKEDFIWTMNVVARINNNRELEDVTVGFATLASILLSLTPELDNLGLKDLSKSITDIKQLNVSDAITDLSELYHPEKINVKHLIRAISGKLNELKDIARQVVVFDDIATTMFSIIQFTDINAQLTSIDNLNEYIDNIGTNYF